MEITLIAVAACLVIGGLAAMSSFNPTWFSRARAREHGALTVYGHGVATHRGGADGFIQTKNSQFSLHKTLLIIGPSANHPACRMQRKLLKPTVPMLIRDDISVMEIYGNASPRRNGEALVWLDSSLLRHALDADEGFFVVYVDEAGKTVFRKKSPMLTEMIAERAGLQINPPASPKSCIQSDIVRRLQAA